jgi:hypothetical protein
MSNCSSALVVPDSLLPKKNTDLLRDHSTDLLLHLPSQIPRTDPERQWECLCPHVHKLPDMHARSRSSRLFCLQIS